MGKDEFRKRKLLQWKLVEFSQWSETRSKRPFAKRSLGCSSRLGSIRLPPFPPPTLLSLHFLSSRSSHVATEIPRGRLKPIQTLFYLRDHESMVFLEECRNQRVISCPLLCVSRLPLKFKWEFKRGTQSANETVITVIVMHSFGVNYYFKFKIPTVRIDIY